MENNLLADGPVVGTPTVGLRIGSVIAALALVLAMVVLVQQRADASPASGAAVAASVVSVGGGQAAQISFAQIACPILISIRNSFASSPFFSFVVAAINPLIIAFGCSPS